MLRDILNGYVALSYEKCVAVWGIFLLCVMHLQCSVITLAKCVAYEALCMVEIDTCSHDRQLYFLSHSMSGCVTLKLVPRVGKHVLC